MLQAELSARGEDLQIQLTALTKINEDACKDITKMQKIVSDQRNRIDALNAELKEKMREMDDERKDKKRLIVEHTDQV